MIARRNQSDNWWYIGVSPFASRAMGGRKLAEMRCMPILPEVAISYLNKVAILVNHYLT
jgi:hypothetical protein